MLNEGNYECYEGISYRVSGAQRRSALRSWASMDQCGGVTD